MQPTDEVPLPECYMRHWINCPFESIELFTADHLRTYAAAAVAAEVERWRVALGACDAALALCQPCADPACGADQREYIDTARAAAAELLRPAAIRAAKENP